MHSFGLTERWLVLAEFPFVVNPLAIALQRPALHRELPLEARARHPVHAVRPRHRRGAPARSRPSPFFCFHHVNAYEEDGEVVVDVCTYEDAEIIEDLYLERLRAGKPAAPAELSRFRITLGAPAVQREQLADGPRAAADQLRPQQRAPLPLRLGRRRRSRRWLDRIVKVDVAERTYDRMAEDGC